MATQKQKEKKKKDHERVAKARVLVRREALRKERKAEKEEHRKFEEVQEIMHGKILPIINNPAIVAQREAVHARAVSDKLKQNLEILEALEREYEAEQFARVEMNDKLESEGHKTMREKMDALHQKALAMTGKAEALAQAEEEYAAQHSGKECVGHQNIEEEIVVEPTISISSQEK
jgi:hypothetical protein